MTPTEAAVALHDAATLYGSALGTAQQLVEAACDALVAGLDSSSLRMLAALTAREADTEASELLPLALAELGLPPIPRGTDAAREAAAALAAQLLAGRLTPRRLASAAHLAFGHRPGLTERLAELDDEYDLLDYSGRTVDMVDADVIAEARRLAARRQALTFSAVVGPPQ